MPSLIEHCKESKLRTGKRYKDLHAWMDEGREFLGINHRRERHNLDYLPFVKEKWNIEGVKEFLHHIVMDWQSTEERINKKKDYNDFPRNKL